jgi:hypothetical protein
MAGEPLVMRLYTQPWMYELARTVSYGGVRPGDLKPVVADLAARHGDGKAAPALHELTCLDRETGLTVLTCYARKLCGQLLGLTPESAGYEPYRQGRDKPAHHRPGAEPKPAAEEDKPLEISAAWPRKNSPTPRGGRADAGS